LFQSCTGRTAILFLVLHRCEVFFISHFALGVKTT
jgi:hypothetical protein